MTLVCIYLERVEYAGSNGLIHSLRRIHHQYRLIQPVRHQVRALDNQSSEELDSLFNSRMLVQLYLFLGSDFTVIRRGEFLHFLAKTGEDLLGGVRIIHSLRSISVTNHE
jgi:hypothetical protein